MHPKRLAAWGAQRLNLRNVAFLGNFGVSKAAVFLLPLLVAALASDAVYGQLEFALALGLQLSALVLGATLAGITQTYLVRGVRGYGAPLLALTIAPIALLVAAALFVIAWGGSWALVLTLSVIAITVFQNTGSTWFRMRGERNRTAWIDGASLLLTGAGVLAAVVLAGRDDLRASALVILSMAILLLAPCAAMLLRRRAAPLLLLLRQATIVGLPMMVAGVFAIWIGVGGRIMVGALSPDALAPYSLAFRIAGLAMGVHQLAVTAAFPRIYGSRVRPGDRLIETFLILVLAVCTGLALIGPYVPRVMSFAALQGPAVALYEDLVPLTALQTFFWIGFALLQSRMNRFGAAKASIGPVIVVTVAGTAVIAAAALLVSSDVRFVALLIAIHAAAYFGTALFVLARRRVPHHRSARIGLIGGVILLAIAGASALRSGAG